MSEGLYDRLVTSESGTAVANTTIPTSLLPAGRRYPIPAAYFDRVGKELKFRASGRISTVVTTPGTLTLELRLGSIVVASSGAMSLNTAAQTNVNWWLEWILRCETLGAGTACTLFHQGKWVSHAVIGSPSPTAGGAGCHLLPYNAAPAVGNGFDGTAAQTLDLFATWSVANAANSIQLHSASARLIF